MLRQVNAIRLKTSFQQSMIAAADKQLTHSLFRNPAIRWAKARAKENKGTESDWFADPSKIWLFGCSACWGQSSCVKKNSRLSTHLLLPSFVRAMEFRRITETHCWVASRFQRQRMMPHMTQKKSFTIDYVIVSALDYVSLMGLL